MTLPRSERLSLIMILLLCAAVPAQEPARAGVPGDPVPEGAGARLGTLRWRAASDVVLTGFLSDGKTLLTLNQDRVAQVWDVATGKEVRRFGPPAGTVRPGGALFPLSPLGGNGVLSADGMTLAIPGRDLVAGCQPAADPPRLSAAGGDPPRASADVDKAVTRERLGRIGRGVDKGLPLLYYARSTNALGLSWRVGLLPYIGERALYERFKLDEPWDSGHNKPLVGKMPDVFRSPRGGAPAGHTFYRAFLCRPVPKDPRRRNPRTAYPPPMTAEQVKARYANSTMPLPLFPEHTVVDGSANTLFFAEAAGAVPWTKPDELVYDPADPLPRLGGVYGDGFFAVSVAGAVVFVPEGTDEKTVRALITSDGDETITDKGLLDQLNAPFPRQPGRPTNPGKE
jgi:hypothetical protein